MDQYLMFLVMAAVAILTPGPSVFMTLTNSINYGFSLTFGGILGGATGVLIVSMIAATGVGVLIENSTQGLAIIKCIGAVYLIYLAVNLWLASAVDLSDHDANGTTILNLFVKGSSLQLTNPCIIIFFISVFPQFIDPNANYTLQLVTLTISYVSLSILIQSMYALFASNAKGFLVSGHGSSLVNKAGATAFVLFSVILFSQSGLHKIITSHLISFKTLVLI